MKDPREMSDEEWALHFAAVKEKRATIAKGVRYEAVQPDGRTHEVAIKNFKSGKKWRNRMGKKHRKHGKKHGKKRRLSFREWFDTLSKTRKNT